MADKDDSKKDDTSSSGGSDKDWPAEVDKWKSLARKHEEQAKKNHDELEKLRKDSDASKSDMDKVKDQIATLVKRAEDAERKALVAEVAAEKKLPSSLARRLSGSTREELETDADELLEAIKPTKDTDDAKGDDKTTGDDTKRSSSRPKEKLTSGASSGDDDGVVDKAKADKIAESILSSGF